MWYSHQGLKAIHKEIFTSLMNSKNGNLIDYEFTTRGLEEIRKRKPHKRQIRRKEYIQEILAVQKEQSLSGEKNAEHIRTYAIQMSKSACARAQHYAELDAHEARSIYKETFVSPLKGDDTNNAANTTSTDSSRGLTFTSLLSFGQDSIARIA
jgi:osmotically-inducible protein OsmY